MSKAKGTGMNRCQGRGKAMEEEDVGSVGPDPTTMQISAETLKTSASVIALGGYSSTGVGPPLRASLPGEGQHWPLDGRCSNLATQPTPPQALSPGEGCCNKRKFTLPQRREEAALLQRFGSPFALCQSIATCQPTTQCPPSNRPFTDNSSSFIHRSPFPYPSTREHTPTPVQPVESTTCSQFRVP